MIDQATIGCREQVATTSLKIAGTFIERGDAFRLVYQNYLRKGLIQPNPFELRVTPYHLLPSTSVFIVREDRKVTCTVTLIGDGQLGVPMESIYPDEVNAARAQGLFIGEVSCLAAGDTGGESFLSTFIQLTRLMAQHARAFGMDQFMIAIHPKHARFYQRFMAFEQIGELKEYPSVRNSPAVALRLNFDRIDRERPACYEQFFGVPLPIDELYHQPMSRQEIDFFSLPAELAGQPVPVSV